MNIIKIIALAVITAAACILPAQAQTTGYWPYYDTSYSNYGYNQSYGYPYNYQYQQLYPYLPPVSLSQTSLSLNVGQVATVTVYGSAPFSVSSSNSYSTWQTITGNTLTVQATNTGSATLTICSVAGSYSSTCANLFVSVGQYYGGGYYPLYPPDPWYEYPHTSEDLLDTNSIEIEVGEREEIEIHTMPRRWDDPYISSNTNRNIASARIDDDELIVTGRREGTTRITVCQEQVCDTVRIRVED